MFGKIVGVILILGFIAFGIWQVLLFVKECKQRKARKSSLKNVKSDLEEENK